MANTTQRGGSREPVTCDWCGKEVKGVGALTNHKKFCGKNPIGLTVGTPPAAHAPLPPAPATITVSNDYAPVSTLEIPVEMASGEGLNAATEKLRGELIGDATKRVDDLIEVDLTQAGEGLTGFYNAQLVAAKMRPLSVQETAAIQKHFEITIKRRLHLLLKYGDIVNLGIAIIVPLMARLDQIPALQKKGAGKAVEQLQRQHETAAQLDDGQRAMLEYEKAKREGAA